MSEEELNENTEPQAEEKEDEDLDDFLNLESLLEEATADIESSQDLGEQADIRVKEDQKVDDTFRDFSDDVEKLEESVKDESQSDSDRPSRFAFLLKFQEKLDDLLSKITILQKAVDAWESLDLFGKAKNFVGLFSNKYALYIAKARLYSIRAKDYFKQHSFPLIGIALCMSAVIYLLTLVGEPVFDLQPERPYINSLEEVADRIISIPVDENFESFYSPLRQPEFFVSMDQVIVQLRSTRRTPRAFGRFEFYVETNNRRSLIEVTDRKSEILDIIQRTLETQTFEDLSTRSGKMKIKRLLRIRINSIMNYGRIREIYFKNFLLKKKRRGGF